MAPLAAATIPTVRHIAVIYWTGLDATMWKSSRCYRQHVCHVEKPTTAESSVASRPVGPIGGMWTEQLLDSCCTCTGCRTFNCCNVTA
jgi:hypothetical protein